MSSPPTAADAAVTARPWRQFLDPATLSLPISLSEASFRLTQNLRYFYPNYALLSLLVFLLSLLTHPLSLILFLCIFSAYIYLFLSRSEPLTVLDHTIDQKIILGFLLLLTLVAVLWTKVWWNIFISSIIGAVIVFLHAVLRAPEEVEEDSPYGSLLNVVDDPRGDYARV
ncbi:PRA1 family D-like [Olea europaea subsp. europaea]|uniref:PRA1 family protein n=1 Tax=Olea europaea subsp. europaea TaxID=158383 RepID=A0A8S0VGY4_OLEEU|nr:PRA1 family D-like [Olea europaea subsp. europaea]